MKFDLIGIGDTDVDLMISVDKLPSHDEKVMGNLLGFFPGGMTANCCCAAAKFGARSGIVTTIGDDMHGSIAMKDFEKYGVDTTGVITKPGEQTFFCVIHLDGTGEKALTLIPTPVFEPTIDDIKSKVDYIRSARYIQTSINRTDVFDYLMQEVVPYGPKLSIDVEPIRLELTRQQKIDLVSKASIIFPNLNGFRSIVGEDVSIEDGAYELLDAGIEIIVVTKGSDGCEIFTNDKHLSIPSFKVDVKDTTAAGDTFNSVFLASICKDYSLEQCAYLATAAAIGCISEYGSHTGLISELEAHEYLKLNMEGYSDIFADRALVK